MKIIDIQNFGAPEVLVPGTRPDPVAGAGEVLIRVRASGINRPDVLQRSGAYPPPPGAPEWPGLEVAGTIESGDAQAMAQAGLRVGDRVCALVAGGGYAELCVAPVLQCLPVPAGLSDIEAASLPETFFTVWSNVFDRGRLQAGETLLIQGGTSGIGVTAIQMSKAAGARVITTVRGAEKASRAEALGADLVIDTTVEDFAVRCRAEGGVDVVLDIIGGDYFARNIDVLNPDGRLVQIATMGGEMVQANLLTLMFKRLTLTASTLRGRPAEEKARLTAAIQKDVMPWIESGKVRIPIDRAIPMEQVGEAHRLLETSQQFGKVVLLAGVFEQWL